MKNFKKILALLIAIIMVIPAIPVVATAETTTTYKSVTELLEDDQYVDDLAGWLLSVRDTTKAPEKAAVADDPETTDVDETADAYGYYYNLNTRDDLIYFMLCGQQTENIDVERPTFLNATFYLKNDITLNYGTATEDGFVPDASQNGVVYTWTPFALGIEGSNANGFRGTFQGGKNTIYGMVIDAPDTDNVGFFATTGNSAYINGIYFEDSYVSGNTYAGTLLGRSYRTGTGRQGLASIRVTDGIVKATADTAGGVIGGTTSARLLIQLPVVTNCKITGTSFVGGIIGQNTRTYTSTTTDFTSPKVIDCTVTATNTSSSANGYAGGIAGYLAGDSTLPNATVTGSTVSTNKDYAGGLVGATKVGDISITNAKVDVTVTGRRYVAGVLGESQGNVTMDGISADVSVTGIIAVAGLFGRPLVYSNSVDKTLSISNCFVDGTVTATGGDATKDTMFAGGFVAATGRYTTTISDSVCCATVSSVGKSGTSPRYSVGGFIGCSEATTTMTNCQFLGKVSGKIEQFVSAFANAVALNEKSYATVPTAPLSTTYNLSFVDCYYAAGSANRAVGTKVLYTHYDISVDYSGDENAAVVNKMTDVAAMTQEDGTTAFTDVNSGDYISANFNTYYVDTVANPKAMPNGAQMGTDGTSARIVATITDSTNVTAVEFASISLNKYMTSVTVSSGSRPWWSYSKAVVSGCDYAYKSLNDNYGLDEITAGENEYLVALGITGISAKTATTLLVRPVYWEDIEQSDGTFKNTRQYGQYMGVVFYNGDILGTFYLS